MKRSMWLGLGLSAAGLLLSLVMWTKVDSPMPIHWNAAGQADGFVAKEIGLTMLPLIGVATVGLLAWVGRKMEQVKAKRVLGHASTLTAAFMLALHALVIQAAMSADQSLSLGIVMSLMGAMIAGLGIFMPGIEQNKYVGVRTPWTLKNETNWKLTHELAGKTMVASGVLSIAISAMSFIAPTVPLLDRVRRGHARIADPGGVLVHASSGTEAKELAAPFVTTSLRLWGAVFDGRAPLLWSTIAAMRLALVAVMLLACGSNPVEVGNDCPPSSGGHATSDGGGGSGGDVSEECE